MLFFLIFSLLVRFFSEYRLAAKFQPGQGLKLRYCLQSQPYLSYNEQVFYYQRHFQRIKVILPLSPRYDFGDCLEITDKITTSSSSSGPMLCLLNPQILSIKNGQNLKFLGLKFQKKMTDFRQRLVNLYLQILPYPEGDLAAGIVLGEKQNLDEDFYQQLRLTGTLHIIVASGYNLSVIGQKPVEYLAYLWGIKPALFVGFLLVWLYVFLVGCQPPVVRAAIMISFLFLAQFTGKKFDQWRALVFAVWLMLMIQPDLIASVSFQLSVAAIFGLFLGGKVFFRLSKVPLIGNELSSILSAQIMVAPVIAYHFGQLSILAPLVNLLLLPLVPIIMGIGLAAVSVGWLPILPQLVLFLGYPVFWGMIFAIESFSKLPFAEMPLKVSFWQVMVTYTVIFFVFHKLSRNKKIKNSKS